MQWRSTLEVVEKRAKKRADQKNMIEMEVENEGHSESETRPENQEVDEVREQGGGTGRWETSGLRGRWRRGEEAEDKRCLRQLKGMARDGTSPECACLGVDGCSDWR